MGCFWNRQFEWFTDVVDLQFSKSGDRVTVNAGVTHSALYARCWGKALSARVEIPQCIAKVRSGELLHDDDTWWPTESMSAMEGIPNVITTKVIPFLDSMHSMQALETFLREKNVIRQRYPPSIIYLAILMCDRGERDGACSILGDLERTSVGGWKARIRDVSKSLHCS